LPGQFYLFFQMSDHPAMIRPALSVVLGFAALLAGAQDAGYNQPYRPQVHFSPRQHWTNDPNGLVYFRGEYHLFFQYNPFGDTWGHMSWGHAVSGDLLHWRELPVAIPEQDGEMVFTGSVVVDEKNTSGLCVSGADCMVAIYTGHRKDASGTLQNQNLAYSRDAGRTWTRYKGNPVLDLHLSDFRDPSVFWDGKAGRWLMAVALPLEHKVRLYTSPDLKHWTQASEFGPTGDVAGDWECPDLLRVPSQAKGSPDLWVMKVGLNPGAPQGGSGEQYFVGAFDGTRFTPGKESGSHGWTNYGKDDYCAISFNHLPAGQKPVLLGWMSNWQYAAKLPTSPWRGQMSLPRRLSYLRDNAGVALRQEPVIAPLRGAHTEITSSAEIVRDAPFELRLHFEAIPQSSFGLKLYSDGEHWTEIAFDPATNIFSMDRTHAGLPVAPEFPAKTIAHLRKERPYDLNLIVDRSSIEAFAQDGTIAMTNLVFPSSPQTRIVFSSGSGEKPSVRGDVWTLHSIW
jgi:sucrose-6-phosphate hydrolase SacC (GH32 family)